MDATNRKLPRFLAVLAGALLLGQFAVVAEAQAGSCGVLPFSSSGDVARGAADNISQLVSSEADLRGGYDLVLAAGSDEVAEGCGETISCLKAFAKKNGHEHVITGRVAASADEQYDVTATLYTSSGTVIREATHTMGRSPDFLIDALPGLVVEVLTGQAPDGPEAQAAEEDDRKKGEPLFDDGDMFGDDDGDDGNGDGDARGDQPDWMERDRHGRKKKKAGADEEEYDPLGLDDIEDDLDIDLDAELSTASQRKKAQEREEEEAREAARKAEEERLARLAADEERRRQEEEERIDRERRREEERLAYEADLRREEEERARADEERRRRKAEERRREDDRRRAEAEKIERERIAAERAEREQRLAEQERRDRLDEERKAEAARERRAEEERRAELARADGDRRDREERAARQAAVDRQAEEDRRARDSRDTRDTRDTRDRYDDEGVDEVEIGSAMTLSAGLIMISEDDEEGGFVIEDDDGGGFVIEDDEGDYEDDDDFIDPDDLEPEDDEMRPGQIIGYSEEEEHPAIARRAAAAEREEAGEDRYGKARSASRNLSSDRSYDDERSYSRDSDNGDGGYSRSSRGSDRSYSRDGDDRGYRRDGRDDRDDRLAYNDDRALDDSRSSGRSYSRSSSDRGYDDRDSRSSRSSSSRDRYDDRSYDDRDRYSSRNAARSSTTKKSDRSWVSFRLGAGFTRYYLSFLAYGVDASVFALPFVSVDLGVDFWSLSLLEEAPDGTLVRSYRTLPSFTAGASWRGNFHKIVKPYAGFDLGGIMYAQAIVNSGTEAEKRNPLFAFTAAVKGGSDFMFIKNIGAYVGVKAGVANAPRIQETVNVNWQPVTFVFNVRAGAIIRF